MRKSSGSGRREQKGAALSWGRGGQGASPESRPGRLSRGSPIWPAGRALGGAEERGWASRRKMRRARSEAGSGGRGVGTRGGLRPPTPSHCTPSTTQTLSAASTPFLEAGGGPGNQPLSAGKSGGRPGQPGRGSPPLLGHARRRLPAGPREPFLQLRAHPWRRGCSPQLNHAMCPEEPARAPLGAGSAPEPRGPGLRGARAAPGALPRPEARWVASLYFLSNPGDRALGEEWVAPFPSPHALNSAEL